MELSRATLLGFLGEFIQSEVEGPFHRSLEMTLGKAHIALDQYKKSPRDAGAFCDQLRELIRSLRLRPGVPWDLVQL